MKYQTLKKRRKEVVERNNKESVKHSPSSLPHDEIFDLLYKFDSHGRLDLSLGLVMSEKCRPEVRQYVEDHLLRSSMVPSSSCYDPDVALENVTPFCLQYGAERDLVAQRQLDKFKEYIEKNKDVS